MKVDLLAFQKAKVLVVGDVMLDRYWQGPTIKISPEAPVPVVKVNQHKDTPGGAANVAMNIASLGGHVSLLGITGEDEAHESLLTQLTGLNIDCHFIQQKAFPTITKLRVMSQNQQLIRLDFEESFTSVNKQVLTDKTKELLLSHDVLLVSDYAKGTLSEVQLLIQQAKSLNIPVLVDPKGTDFTPYTDATILTPNFSEFEAVAGQCNSELEIVEKGQKLLHSLGLEALLVTRSEKGMTLLRKDSEEFHLPAQTTEVFDVTGAGDTVIATLALAVAVGASLSQASALANTAAGIVVRKLGTSSISEAELAQELHNNHESGSGVITEEQLSIVVKWAKERNETVVMTNGCFDILHSGHVSYLEEAKKLGHRLIVAVNDDESVKRLKGSGRPVNPLARRMAVLAGLASVDWVVSFSEDTPQRLISNILPSILVKGGDYTIDEIAGGKEVMADGGEVKVLNFEDGVSTSGIIKTILDT